MGTSSEDVLLMVGQVRYKKNDGTLYLMAERIAWMLEGKDTFAVSHKYSDMKMQKISPEGKPKIQLQVVLHNGDATTFHFVNPMGLEAQLQDRNSVKELLQQLLPKFKKKLNSELEEKNRILQEDPKLFELYKNLVMSQVTTPEEFWADHAPKPNNRTNTAAQDVGVSAAFLVDVKPQTDGCNGLKYNITADIIESIFKTYPAVKKKHMENVPHKLSESEFWTKFFQSHYFHRDRLNTSSKDLFAECVKSDEQDIKGAIGDSIKDPFVDVSSFEDKSVLELNNEIPVDPKNQGSCSANQSMIRRFNHHSMMILKACESRKSSSSLESTNGNSAVVAQPVIPNGCLGNKHQKDSTTEASEAVSSKKAKIHEKTQLEDLENVSLHTCTPMSLVKPDRYHHGPTAVSNAEYFSREDIIQSTQQLNHEISSWTAQFQTVLPTTSALSALGELSPGGVLMKNVQNIPFKDTVPEELQRELKNVYIALCELLRHFWSCFPTTTPQLEEKAIKMRSTLERFQYARLQPFQDKLLREHYNTDMAVHLMDMLKAAYTKFSNWQAKRVTLGRK